MIDKLRVGGTIFYGTATITELTNSKIYYHCDICGKDHNISVIGYEMGKVKMCTYCKYNGLQKKCIKAMKANKAKIDAEIKKAQEEIAITKYNSTHKGKLEVLDDSDPEEYLIKCNDCGEEYLYKKVRFDELRSPMCLKCGKRGGYVNQEGKTFGKLTITRELGGGEVDCKCETCGIIETYNKTQVVKKLAKCKTCKSNDEEVAEPIGWAGSIINDLYVVKEQLNGTTDVKTYCLICGRLLKVPIGSLMNKTAKCVCNDKPTMLKCRYCGKDTYQVDMKNKRIRCTNQLCPGIGKISTFDNEYKVNVATGLYNITLREEYNQSVDRLDYEIKGDKHGHKCLVIFKRPIYLGRDRRRYYRCYCLAHKKYLLLSYNEIGDINKVDNIDYNHDLCSSEFDMDINYTE